MGAFYMVEYELPPGEWASWNSDEWVCDECPFCGREKKFTWNVVKNLGNCWVCDKRIWEKSYFYYLTRNADKTLVEYKENIIKVPEISMVGLVDAWDHKDSREFLKARNVTELSSRQAQIEYLPSKKTLMIPLYPNSKGLPNSYLWRKLPLGKWYFKKGTSGIFYIWNWQKFIKSNSNILVCEGIFDLLPTKLHKNGVAVLGSKIPDFWYRFFKENCNKLVLWFDADKAGEKATYTISEKCLYWDIPFSVIRSSMHPKSYSRNLKSEKKFLEFIEQVEIPHNSIKWSRRYIIKK